MISHQLLPLKDDNVWETLILQRQRHVDSFENDFTSLDAKGSKDPQEPLLQSNLRVQRRQYKHDRQVGEQIGERAEDLL